MANVFEMVTDRIIAEMEKGIIPWHKPWTGSKAGAFNRVSKKPYSMLNQMMLMHSGEYATFKQWSDLGGKVRRGEKSEIVVFWKWIEREVEKDNGEKEIEKIPYLRYINVFHISQVEGVEPLGIELQENESIEDADNVINGYISRYGIGFQNDEVSNEAYYSPAFDNVVVPCKEQYKNINEYYSTTFHELAHSTGHKSRLDRLVATGFGTSEYSKEELVAEIGSASLMNYMNIETESTFKNSTAYIQSWIAVLKNDTKFIVSAAGKAEKAVNMILDI